MMLDDDDFVQALREAFHTTLDQYAPNARRTVGMEARAALAWAIEEAPMSDSPEFDLEVRATMIAVLDAELAGMAAGSA